MEKKELLINDDELERALNELGYIFRKKVEENLPDEEEFFRKLNQAIEREENQVYFKKENVETLSSHRWKFFSQKWFYAAALMVFVVFSVVYFFDDLMQKQQPIIENQKMGVGSPMVIPEAETEQERELLQKLFEEEDPEKKQKYLDELLKYYKQTNQEEKIKKLIEAYD
ncbi:MAG: hypothetical protein NZ853_03935 [Leptospiraceae bacterium]|nr:hypothetical protein [Leptospiraceae bacterium]MDW7975325.1 hypothetical protein [Leptospiraceae bacterium]